jgi:hypothetical protein
VTGDSLSICIDCAAAGANGVAAVENAPDGWRDAYAAATAAHGGRYPMPTAGGDCAPDCEECEPSFSWYPCEWCGSRLGGDRFSAVAS